MNDGKPRIYRQLPKADDMGWWLKCAYCGKLYQITDVWASQTVCSEDCRQFYIDWIKEAI